jgi:DNA (cytosine-5)-methyltransferase 1
MKSMRSLELFSGAGGLALGLDKAGCEHAALIEWNREACDTMRLNHDLGINPVSKWRIIEADARKVDYSEFSGVNLIAGGPPCQPFSLGGKHRGKDDQRNMFPEAVRAVRELAPEVFIFENVKGLLRESFSSYFEYVMLQLHYPLLTRKPNEEWMVHLSRLEKHHTAGKQSDLSYQVVHRLLNASDFGIPQQRHRVFIVGFRSDLGREWCFPCATHSLDALLYAQWITGEYWDEHRIPRTRRPACPARALSRIDRLRVECKATPPMRLRWRTVRDAVMGLPDPETPAAKKVLNHEFREGARAYPGHTGSLLDEPAKALKAGDHGVPGGENMMALPNGSVRYFTVRESARLQTFPDNYAFASSWTESMRQLGNAVPVELGRTVADSVLKQVG